ncbi:DUF1349 domain-containing protein [Rhizobium sp. LjRoot98]|uniref:DUF1349 domain-containing protein n=1 Tax=Rhizobium sp. LjRoot98 TaxID=3342345 RepID=UPI003F4F5197
MAGAFRWHNELAVWQGDAARLSLKTDAETDFRQETFYGFHRDSGHAYLAPISGDFTVRSAFRAADAP